MRLLIAQERIDLELLFDVHDMKMGYNKVIIFHVWDWILECIIYLTKASYPIRTRKFFILSRWD